MRGRQNITPGQAGRVVWASDQEYAEIGAMIGPALSRPQSVPQNSWIASTAGPASADTRSSNA